MLREKEIHEEVSLESGQKWLWCEDHFEAEIKEGSHGQTQEKDISGKGKIPEDPTLEKPELL